LVITQQLWHPSCRLLFQAQVVVKDLENGFFRDPMGSSDLLHGQAAIFFNDGGHRGDELRSPHVFFRIEMAQISGGFVSLHLLNDGVDRRFLQR
jgi:hypothetical protein